MSNEKDQCQPMRMKYWNELSIEEKLERLREQVRGLKPSVRAALDGVEQLKEHEHSSTGKAMININSRFCDDPRFSERENEYF